MEIGNEPAKGHKSLSCYVNAEKQKSTAATAKGSLLEAHSSGNLVPMLKLLGWQIALDRNVPDTAKGERGSTIGWRGGETVMRWITTQ